VNGVIIVVKGGTPIEVAHEIALHVAFAKPLYLNREDVPQSEIDAERKTDRGDLPATRASPKRRLPKIIEGRTERLVQGPRPCSSSPTCKDEKQTIAQLLGSASITAFAQVVIGG
jgi:elongation factor Ts